MTKTCIIIVNYRTAELVVDCLRSIATDGWLPGRTDAEKGKRGRVIVVDNASGDDTVELLRQALAEGRWQDWVEVIAAERNGGFAYGNNVAIRRAIELRDRLQYILLLNPDTVVRPGAIQALVRFMEEHPRAGIVGSRLEDPDGTQQRSAFRFPTIAGELDAAMGLGVVTKLLARKVIAPPVRDEAHRTDWVAGASMLIRREVLEQIGLLDEGYFMYYEEVDFCFRARQAGWDCWYVPTSRVVHLVGKASGLNSADAQPQRRPAYWFESRRRYFQKNHGRAYAALADAAWLMGNLTWKMRRVVQRKPSAAPPFFWRDMLRHSSLLRGMPGEL